MKKYILSISIIIGCVILAGAFIYVSNKKVNSPASQIVDNQNQPSLDNFYNSSSTVSSSPVPTSSPLNTSITSTPNIRIDIQYEEPKYSRSVSLYPQSSGTYTDPGSGEQYLLLSKRINTAGYGDREYSIFQAKESHSYQGTPIYLSSVQNNQSLSYVGLKINDPSLVNSLRVELGVDYFAQPRGQQLGFVEKVVGKIASWFTPERVEACGPGIYLRNVGDSNMSFVGIKDGIAWYKLDKEISVNNIPLTYCNGKDCDYSPAIKDLTNGNLRMHIDYVPGGNKGVLKMQLSDVIFHNQLDGSFTKATLGKDAGDMYRAILSDQEYGSLSFKQDLNNYPVLDLVLTNQGNDPITVDDYSFNRIRNSYVGKQAVGFVVKDSRNADVAHISLNSLLNQTKGKTIQPNEYLTFPAFSAASVQDGLYTISVEYASTTAQAPVAPRLINWDFRDGESVFTSNGQPMYAFITGRKIINSQIIPLYPSARNLDNPQGPTYGLSYLFPSAGYYSQFSTQANVVSQYSIHQTTVNEIQNNTGALYSYFVPLSSSQLLSQLGAQVAGSLTDFEGNRINIYTRGSVTGYAVERDIKNYNGSDSIHGTIIYEVPSNYLNDSTFKQIYELTVQSASFRQSN